MKHAAFIVIAFALATFLLAAYLSQPAVLLVLALLPSLLQTLPFGLLVGNRMDDDDEDEDDLDRPRPMGFTQDVK